MKLIEDPRLLQGRATIAYEWLDEYLLRHGDTLQANTTLPRYVKQFMRTADNNDRDTLQVEYSLELDDVWWDSILIHMLRGHGRLHIWAIDTTVGEEVVTTLQGLDVALGGNSVTVLKGQSLLVPANASMDSVAKLIDALRAGGLGIIDTSVAGELWFRPSHDLLMAAKMSGLETGYTFAKGILLAERHHDLLKPTLWALQAGAFWDAGLTNGTFLCLIGSSQKFHVQSLYILLRGARLITRNQFFFIVEPPRRISGGMTAYATAAVLRCEAKQLRSSMGHVTDFSKMPSHEYLHDDYLEGTNHKSEYGFSPDDVELIKFIVARLPGLLQKESLECAVIPGYGPVSFLAWIFEPYLRKNGKLYLTDPLESNIVLAQAIRDGTAAPDEVAVGEKIEKMLVALGGERYRGCNESMKRRAIIQKGTLQTASSLHPDVMGSCYLECSITTTKEAFAALLEAGPRVPRIAMHMLGSEEWNNGLPSVHRLRYEDMVQLYADRGYSIIAAHEATTDIKLRNGYTSLGAIIAIPSPQLVKRVGQ